MYPCVFVRICSYICVCVRMWMPVYQCWSGGLHGVWHYRCTQTYRKRSSMRNYTFPCIGLLLSCIRALNAQYRFWGHVGRRRTLTRACTWMQCICVPVLHSCLYYTRAHVRVSPDDGSAHDDHRSGYGRRLRNWQE
jgi:hypothetical protein